MLIKWNIFSAVTLIENVTKLWLRAINGHINAATHKNPWELCVKADNIQIWTVK